VAQPGEHASSVLANALLADSDPHMPPKKQLTDPQIQLIRNWIQAGITWDETVLTQDDVSGPVELSTLPPSYQPVMALAIAPDAKRLAVARGGQILLHDAAAKYLPVLEQIDAHRDAVQAIAWSADGRWLASGAFRRVVLWDATTFKLAHEWTEGWSGRITALQFAPDSG
jgi:WD40 repeat protein